MFFFLKQKNPWESAILYSFVCWTDCRPGHRRADQSSQQFLLLFTVAESSLLHLDLRFSESRLIRSPFSPSKQVLKLFKRKHNVATASGCLVPEYVGAAAYTDGGSLGPGLDRPANATGADAGVLVAAQSPDGGDQGFFGTSAGTLGISLLSRTWWSYCSPRGHLLV